MSAWTDHGFPDRVRLARPSHVFHVLLAASHERWVIKAASVTGEAVSRPMLMFTPLSRSRQQFRYDIVAITDDAFSNFRNSFLQSSDSNHVQFLEESAILDAFGVFYPGPAYTGYNGNTNWAPPPPPFSADLALNAYKVINLLSIVNANAIIKIQNTLGSAGGLKTLQEACERAIENEQTWAWSAYPGYRSPAVKDGVLWGTLARSDAGEYYYPPYNTTYGVSYDRYGTKTSTVIADGYCADAYIWGWFESYDGGLEQEMALPEGKWVLLQTHRRVSGTLELNFSMPDCLSPRTPGKNERIVYGWMMRRMQIILDYGIEGGLKYYDPPDVWNGKLF